MSLADRLASSVTAWAEGSHHFVAATPRVRAFVGYYPTVRDIPTTELRPVHPWEDVKKFNCPSTVLYDRDDVVTTIPVPDKGCKSFPVNGQSLE